MSEKLKGLLEKINQEGVKQAEENARAIELKAKKAAENVLEDARSQAQKIVKDAKEAAKKTTNAASAALKQASRDLILSLKDDIRKILNKIVSAETAKAMSSEEVRAILGKLVDNYVEKN